MQPATSQLRWQKTLTSEKRFFGGAVPALDKFNFKLRLASEARQSEGG
jgi:hypothetical protein